MTLSFSTISCFPVPKFLTAIYREKKRKEKKRKKKKEKKIRNKQTKKGHPRKQTQKQPHKNTTTIISTYLSFSKILSTQNNSKRNVIPSAILQLRLNLRARFHQNFGGNSIFPQLSHIGHPLWEHVSVKGSNQDLYC